TFPVRQVVWPLSLAFVDIVLHRRGPQDLPASQFLLGLVLIAYAVVMAVVLIVISATRVDVILMMLELVVDLAVVYLVLAAFQKARRFLQTATALVGTAVLLSLINI